MKRDGKFCWFAVKRVSPQACMERPDDRWHRDKTARRPDRRLRQDRVVSRLGARAVGEIGLVGVAAAVGNAIFHATGQRLGDLPMTPDKVLRLCAAADRKDIGAASAPALKALLPLGVVSAEGSFGP